MIVVADTSPLNYLIQIECDRYLPRLYGKVLIPRGVLEELSRPAAPAKVRSWMRQRPVWLEVSAVRTPGGEELASLDLGEREAIQLASERGADLLLIDERRGYLAAERMGLTTTGTLGVLLNAGRQQWIDAELAYRRLLHETTFRTSKGLEAMFLGQLGR